MRSKIIVSSLVFSILFLFSCKNKDEEQKAEEKKVNPNTFKVQIEGIFKKNDELILFWKDKSISFFDDNHTIYQGIMGKESFQKIVFEFQEGEIPNDIRIDISSKKEQNEITLNYIRFEQQDRSFMIPREKLNQFFRPNEFLLLDSKTGQIITKELNSNYDPILFTTPEIYPQLELVLNTKF